MPVEIQMLVCAVALLVLVLLIQATTGVLQIGLIKALGNRDGLPPLTGYAARTLRCLDNSVVSIAIFAPLALATVLVKQADQWSALGSQVYLYGRVGFAACYLIGIPYLRTLCWVGSLAGIALVGYSLYV